VAALQLTAAPAKLSTSAAWNCGCSTADRSSSQVVDTGSWKLWLLSAAYKQLEAATKLSTA